MSKENPIYLSVDDYINEAPEEMRERLAILRELMRSAIPGATEKISWEMPSYYLEGKAFIHFAYAQKHISIFSGSETVEAMRERFAGYVSTKGGIQLPMKLPLPVDLIREIIEYKLENVKK